MLNFNALFDWNWGAMDMNSIQMPALNQAWLSNIEQQIAAINTVAVQAAVASPAVISSPTNTAPDTTAVAQVVQQVVTAVAPVIAPQVPQVVVDATIPILTNIIIDNSDVLSAATGKPISTSAVNTIIKDAITTAVSSPVIANGVVASIPSDVIAQLPPSSQPTVTQAVDQATQNLGSAQTVINSDFVSIGLKPVDPRVSGGTMAAPSATTATTADTMAARVTAAQSAVDSAQSALDAAKASGNVSAAASASLALNAAQKELAAAQRGIDTTGKTRQDVIGEMARQNVTQERKARAEEGGPLFDPTMRPDAPPSDGKSIFYYSWIGDQWRLYKQDIGSATPSELNTAQARSVGGKTAGTFESIVGANTLVSTGGAPRVTPSETTSGTTGASTAGAGTTGGTVTGGGVPTGGAVTGGADTGQESNQDYANFVAALNQQKIDYANLVALLNQQKIDNAAADAAAKAEKAQNAISVLTARFSQYGLQSLIPKIKELAIGGATEATITLQLMETWEYQQRFSANKDRVKMGLSVLDPGDYLRLEDNYRQILRAYGLRQFDNDDYVTQFIANDISAAELSSRVVTAVQRVQNADPAIMRTLRDFYGIGTTDLVAYVLDPSQQFQKIERQVAAAEIGTAARRQGLDAGVGVAEQLAAQGISQAEAQKGYATIADILPQAAKLSEIYTDVLDQYGQAEAEQEVFNQLASAQRKRRALSEREIASFSGSSGLGRTSLTQQTGGNI